VEEVGIVGITLDGETEHPIERGRHETEFNAP